MIGKQKTRRKWGENLNAEPVVLVALPGKTIIAWSCLLVMVLHTDLYGESGTYLQSILKGNVFW